MGSQRFRKSGGKEWTDLKAESDFLTCFGTIPQLPGFEVFGLNPKGTTAEDLDPLGFRSAGFYAIWSCSLLHRLWSLMLRGKVRIVATTLGNFFSGFRTASSIEALEVLFACQATLNLNQKALIPEVARSLKARKEFKGVGLYRGSLSVSTAKSVCYCQAVWDSGSATKGRSSVEWVFRVEGVGLFYVSKC